MTGPSPRRAGATAATAFLAALGLAASLAVPGLGGAAGAAPGSPVASGASAAPATTPTTSPATTPAPAAAVAPAAKPRKPKPATRTRKARHVPAYPPDGGKGRRIVYDKALMTVWIVGKDDRVVARYPVVGRWDRPLAGKYRIYSKSPTSSNAESQVTFDHMVRFAWGRADGGLSIGFHSIPRYRDGKRMHGIDQLGLPIARGGCVRMADDAAAFLYRWAKVGDRVVVLPSP